MRFVLKAKWLVIIIWIAALAVLLFTAPNMGDLVRKHGQGEVPDGYPSSEASNLLKQMNQQEGSKDSSSTALVFYKKGGMTKTDKQEAKQGIEKLKDHKKELGITNITSVFDNSDLRDQLVSDDGSTILTSVDIHLGDRSPAKLKEQLYDTLKGVDVDHYFTGDWLIQEDYTESTQDGLHQTEWITVIFILVVLLLVFRSVVAPLLPLVTVGITYLASQSVVSFLVKWFDFPISNFTQIFLVAVLFGIGTDYCILLMNRFKEELPKHESVPEAIVHTYKSAGRTMFFSGISVLVGFATIGLSTFSIYQSAVGVAVGIAVLIIALTTLVPIFMGLLGKGLFWPSKKTLQHKESRFWGGLGKFSLTRPLISIFIVAIVTVPLILTYNNQKTYNLLEEMPESYGSVKGFNLLSDHFGPGQSMPTTIVIKNDEKMDRPKYLKTIEAVTQEVKKVDHVKTVRSVTEPEGKRIKDFFVPYQAKTLEEGLGDAKDGLDKIAGGLNDAKKQLADSKPQMKKAVKGFDPLISGTKDLQGGVNDLKSGLQKIENGLDDSSSGAAQLKDGLAQAKQGASQLADQSNKLLNGYQQMQNGLGQLSSNYGKIQGGVKQMADQLGTIEGKLKQLGADHPDIVADPNYQYAVGATQKLQDSAGQLNQNLAKLNKNLNMMTQKMNQANQGFGKLVDGQKQFASQLQGAVDGITKLQNGLDQLAKGQQKAVGNIPKISKGLGGINSGQARLKNGFSKMIDQLSQLTGGLGKSVDGLNKVSGGIQDSRNYLSGLSQSSGPLSGFYIPSEAIHNKDFKKSLDNYMSDNRKFTTLDVVFKTSPYSDETIGQVGNIQAAVDRATDDTPLENAKIGIGGASSTYHDMKQISDKDYTQTVILMLIGIGLILIALLRSFIMPMYILLSLVATYYTSISIAEFLFVHVLGYSGLNWAMPFFGFVVLMALGVDYSIFLMDRFNEHRNMPVKDAILHAMKNMGGVISSAAIILGGTFAAMMPSGVMALVEFATILIVGLLLYNILMLPLFIPVMVKMFGKANWWPFKRSDE